MEASRGRTCVACRRVRGKEDLLRVVRRAGGGVAVDRPGVAPGRGAYLCRGGDCAARPARMLQRQLARALRLPAEESAALQAVVETLRKEVT